MVVYVEKKVLEDPAIVGDNSFGPVKRKFCTFREGEPPASVQWLVSTVPGPWRAAMTASSCFLDYDDISNQIDFIICLGGDGTLLYASSLFQVRPPSVLGCPGPLTASRACLPGRELRAPMSSHTRSYSDTDGLSLTSVTWGQSRFTNRPHGAAALCGATSWDRLALSPVGEGAVVEKPSWGSCPHRQRHKESWLLRALVGKGSSHRLTLQGTGGDAGRRKMARVCAGCQGGHLSPPSPGRTQPGALDGQVWRPWRGPGREHGGQWGTTSRSCGQCGLGPGHQVAWISKSQCCRVRAWEEE